MPIFDRNFDSDFFWKTLWRKVYNFILNRDLTVSDIAKKLWKNQPDISNLLNWKRTTKNIEQYKEISICAWMSEKEFDKIFNEAREAEFEHSTGLPIGWMDLDEYEQAELLKVLFSKEWSRTPTQEDIETILSVIRSMR